MAVTIYCIADYFKGELKLLQRGEDAVRSNHVQTFTYDGSAGVFCGKVHASMKNKVYDVHVRNTIRERAREGEGGDMSIVRNFDSPNGLAGSGDSGRVVKPNSEGRLLLNTFLIIHSPCCVNPYAACVFV